MAVANAQTGNSGFCLFSLETYIQLFLLWMKFKTKLKLI